MAKRIPSTTRGWEDCPCCGRGNGKRFSQRLGSYCRQCACRVAARRRAAERRMMKMQAIAPRGVSLMPNGTFELDM